MPGFLLFNCLADYTRHDIFFVMVRRTPQQEVPLYWVGSAKSDFLALPAEVIDDMGFALGVAQLGGKHPDSKPWKGEGPGVLEVVEQYDGNAYRAVYTVRFAGVIYVLHAFQKKSPAGIKTAKSDIDLVHERLKRARRDYETRVKTDER